MDPFKAMLLKLSENLKRDNVAKLTFLCGHKIGRKKCEEIESGIQLFELLIQRAEIGPDSTEYLRKLLDDIGRQDLLKIIDDYEQGSTPDDLPDREELEKINIATDVLVEQLGKKWRQYGRKLNISDGKLEGIEEKHPRSLEEKVREVIKEWKKLRKEQAKVEELIEALRTSKLNLTADLVVKALQNANTS